MANTINVDFEASIDNLSDYIKLLHLKVEVDERVDEFVLQRNFLIIDEAARNKVWQMLFSSETPLSKEHQDDIGAFLKEIKANAALHSPWEYNEWIVKVRDELLRRNMIDFWRDQIVQHELGPCTWRDSDYLKYDECGDIAEFYHHAGCFAPFERLAADGEPWSAKKINNIEDYRKAMDLCCVKDYAHREDQLEEFDELSEVTRNSIWQLLFEKTPVPVENLENAAKLLKQSREDASIYAPWDYNEWIVKVRDELLKRNMIDFWRDVIVKDELGLIWAGDSVYFEDFEDPAPALFSEYAGCKAPFKLILV